MKSICNDRIDEISGHMNMVEGMGGGEDARAGRVSVTRCDVFLATEIPPFWPPQIDVYFLIFCEPAKPFIIDSHRAMEKDI